MNSLKLFFEEYKRLAKAVLEKEQQKLYIAFTLTFLFLLLSITAPVITKTLIDNVILEGNLELLNVILIAMITIWVITSITDYLHNFLLIVLGVKADIILKKRLFSHLLKLPLNNYYRKEYGEVFYRLFNDTTRISEAISLVPITLIINLIYFIIVYAALFYLHSTLAFCIVPFTILHTIVLVLLGKRIKTNEQQSVTAWEKLQAKVLDSLSNIRLIKSMATESTEENNFSNSMTNIYTIDVRKLSSIKIGGILSNSINNFLLFFVLWYGTQQIIAEKFTIGGLMAFISFAMMTFQPINIVTNIIIGFFQNSVNFVRYAEIEKYEEEDYCAEGKNIETKNGSIDFRNVSFSHSNGNDILKNVSFSIPQGSKVAIQGDSGIGKSTLCDLICRFYVQQEGEILVSGIDNSKLALSELRKRVGYIFQNNYTFSGTIYENITYGVSHSTKEDVIKAAKEANAHSFIINLPEGYNTKIGDKNLKISGGEAQRIAIARLFLKNPDIVIWDEATTFLDIKNEQEIIESLKELIREKTALIISHKSSLFDNYDMRIEIEENNSIKIYR